MKPLLNSNNRTVITQVRSEAATGKHDAIVIGIMNSSWILSVKRRSDNFAIFFSAASRYHAAYVKLFALPRIKYRAHSHPRLY
jgi:hypothetical protein